MARIIHLGRIDFGGDTEFGAENMLDSETM